MIKFFFNKFKTLIQKQSDTTRKHNWKYTRKNTKKNNAGFVIIHICYLQYKYITTCCSYSYFGTIMERLCNNRRIFMEQIWNNKGMIEKLWIDYAMIVK